MINRLYTGLVSSLVLLTGAGANAGDAAVRIRCDASAEGGNVYINEILKGTCSQNALDSFVPPGTVKIRVVKAIDATHEGVYEKEIYLGEDSAQRVEISSLSIKLNAEGLRQQAEAEAERQQEAAAKVAREIEAERLKAEGGNIPSIESLISRYQQGNGVAKDAEQAKFWDNKLAEAMLGQARIGNLAAMDDVAQRYTQGRGLQLDSREAKFWADRAAATRTKIAEENRKIDRISSINYTYFIEAQLDFVGDFDETNRGDGNFFLWVTCLPVRLMSPVFMLTDLLLTPSKYSSKILIANDLALRPSKWAKPDSMIAKAATQEQEATLALR